MKTNNNDWLKPILEKLKFGLNAETYKDLLEAEQAILAAIKERLPGEKEAINEASDHDERHCFFSAKYAYMQAIEDTLKALGIDG